MVERRTLLLGGAGLVLVALLASVVVIGPSDFFVPEDSTTVDETPVGDDETIARGSFVGTAGHEVSGTVLLNRDEDGLYLQFLNYSQTQGPDVFVYVTPSATPDTESEIAGGTKVLIDGGADGGESTKEGTFTQRLPDGVTAADIEGVGIWCERFATPFGYADLDPADG